MTYKKVKQKLQKLYAAEIKNLIVHHRGAYILYDVYMIRKKLGLWEVIRYGQFINTFENSATAISWCLADRTNQIMLAHSLIQLDNRLQTKKNEINVQREYLKIEPNADRKAIVLTRITNDIYICKCLKLEISNQVEMTKYIQIKGFLQS